MKKISMFSIVLLTLVKASYGYDLKGSITRDSTLTIEYSPYNITGDLFINNGAHLSINSGVVINIMSSAYEIFVGSSATSKGSLTANNAVFNGYVTDVNADEVFIQYGSTANFTGCTFNNSMLVINESSPVIQNSLFENVTYPVEFINECSPTLSGLTFNGVTNRGIKLSGTINTNYTLPNYNLPYFITNNLTVNTGAILEIASGDTIRFSSTYDIVAGSSTSSRGVINGSNVFFKGYASAGDQLTFNYGSTGTLTGCTFENIDLLMSTSSPTVSNSVFRNSLITMNESSPALSNLTIETVAYPLEFINECSPTLSGLTFNGVTNRGIKLSGTINTNYTLPNYNLPYFITNNLTVNTGAILEIASGDTIRFSSTYDIVAGSSTTSRGVINGSNVFFKGYASAGDQLTFNYGSTGTLTGCTFENIDLLMSTSSPTVSNSVFRNSLITMNESSPALSNLTIETVAYPLEFINECSPTLSGLTFNGVTNRGIKLSGTINTNYTLPNYNLPYFITNNLTVNTGAILEIASGDTIRFSSTYDIVAGSSTTSRGVINGSNVFFKGYASAGDQLTFNYGSTGTLTGCTFENIDLLMSTSSPTVSNSVFRNSLITMNESSPALSNLTIETVAYPLEFINECSPTLSGLTFNGVTNRGIKLSGTINTNYTLPNYNLPYFITNNLTVNTGAILEIASGDTIRFSSTYDIVAGSSTTSRGVINGSNVFFKGYASAGDQLTFNYGSTGTLTGCTFENIDLLMSTSSPTVSNSVFRNSLITMNESSPALSNLTIETVAYPLEFINECSPTLSGLTFNGVTNRGIKLSGTINTNYTLPNYNMPYYVTSNITVNAGATLTIETMDTLLFYGSYSMTAGTSSTSRGTINATRAMFKSLDNTDNSIYFRYNSEGTLTECNFQTIRLYLDGSSPSITKSKFHNSQNSIYLINNAMPVILNNDFYRNTEAFKNAGTNNVVAANNYWGHYSGPKNITNPSGLGELFTGSGDFIPFSETPFTGLIQAQSLEQQVVFGDLFIGAIDNKTVRLINRGDIDLLLASFATTNPSFTVLSQLPLWISPKDTVEIAIKFAPCSPGAQEGTVSLNTSDPVNRNIVLTASGAGKSVISLTDKILDFGQVYLKNTKTLEFSVKNISESTVKIDSIALPGSEYTIMLSGAKTSYDENNPQEVIEFLDQETKGISVSIEKGVTKAFLVSFKPVTTGNKDGNLRLYYNNSGIEVIDLNAVGYADPISVGINSLDYKNFPFIYLNVKVDSFGVNMQSLLKNNFQIWEDGELQEDYFTVVSPGESGGSRLADIIFIMDNSGSMSDEQAQIRSNVNDFVSNLESSGIDYALGLCRYGASNGLTIEDNGNLATDADYFRNVVWNRNTISGGYEPGYEAIVKSSSGFSFRPGTHKVFVIITDETPAQGSVTQLEALSACTNSSITLFALTTTSLFNMFTPITSQSNGDVYDIRDPFDQILDYITTNVSSPYLLQYRSTHADQLKQEHTVVVKVQYGNDTDSDTISYKAGDLPEIKRTESTIFLHTQAWGLGSPITISAIITDENEPLLQYAKLFYRTTGELTYNSITLTDIGDNVYEGIVPSSEISAPGLDYYILATDGAGTITDPSVDPIMNPYQIAILPNRAPLIIHSPVDFYEQGKQILIRAQITDNTNNLTKAELCYRKEGQLIYNVITLTNIGNDTFEGTIQESFYENGNVEYYIRATDDYNVSNYSGWPDSPHLIRLLSYAGNLRISKLNPQLEYYSQDIVANSITYKYLQVKKENNITFGKGKNTSFSIIKENEKIPITSNFTGTDTLLVIIPTELLKMTPGDEAEIFIDTIIVIDNKVYKVLAMTEPFKFKSVKGPEETTYSIFASGSLGAEVFAVGVGAGVGSIKASSSLLTLSVEGQGGMGMSISKNESNDLTLSRRGELGLAVELKIPDLELACTEIVMGITAGLEGNALFSQTLKIPVSDNSDVANMVKAGFMLETMGLAGVQLSPLVGLYLQAINRTLLKYTNLQELLLQRRYEQSRGWNAKYNASIGLGIQFPKQADDLLNLNFVEVGLEGTTSHKKISYPNQPGRITFLNETSLDKNIEAASFSTDILKDLSVYNYTYSNYFAFASQFDNDELFELTATHESADNYNLLNSLQLNYSTSYSRYTFNQGLLKKIIASGEAQNIKSFVLTSKSPTPIAHGPETFFENLEQLLSITKDVDTQFDEPVILESFENSGYGLDLPINIDLQAVLGGGFGFSCGFRLEAMRETELLRNKSLYLGGKEFKVNDYNYKPSVDIDLLAYVSDLFSGTVDLLTDALVNSIQKIVQNIESGLEWLAKVTEKSVDFLVATGKTQIKGNLSILYFNPAIKQIVQTVYSPPSVKYGYTTSEVKGLNDISTEGSKDEEERSLTIIGYNYIINVYKEDGSPVSVFSDSIRLDFDVVDSLLTANDFTLDYKPLVGVFHFNDSIQLWEEVKSTIKENTLTSFVKKPGSYALGVLYSQSDDKVAPDIVNISPSNMSTLSSPYPTISANIYDDKIGSGIDLSKCFILLGADTLEAIWSLTDHRLFYTVNDSLPDGNYTFKIIASDRNSNEAEITQSFILKQTVGITEPAQSGADFLIYPNPVNNQKFYIKLPAGFNNRDISIRLYDSKGTFCGTLYNGYLDNSEAEIPLYLESTTTGIYLVEIDLGDHRYFKKVIVH